ncbi:MAG: hypothetical protein EHM81_04090, partial [Chloroflexi bacterium]
MDESIQRLLDLLIQIQQIPAPTFEEQKLAEFILGMFRQEGLSDVQLDSAGNALARLPGEKAAPRSAERSRRS